MIKYLLSVLIYCVLSDAYFSLNGFKDMIIDCCFNVTRLFVVAFSRIQMDLHWLKTTWNSIPAVISSKMGSLKQKIRFLTQTS